MSSSTASAGCASSSRRGGTPRGLPRHVTTTTGVDRDCPEGIRARAREQGLESAFVDLRDTLVQQHALCGPPAVCRERLAAYRAAGLELPVLFPDPHSLQPAIRHLAGA